MLLFCFSQLVKSNMPHYIGRFAPSPTGQLHFGSLLTAVASYLDAKSNNGTWLVRMEDLDPPREMPGAADHILSTLEQYGLHWDGSVVYQSQRHALYESVIQLLLAEKQAFYCTCTRKQLAKSNPDPNSMRSPNSYPGNCRDQHTLPSDTYSIRLRVEDQNTCINDGLQGLYCQNIERAVGDFIIKRKDLLYAYHLAVVVDDHEQKISHIVRGIDLLDSTPRQCFLQQCLGYSTPYYSHLPIIVNSLGQKLSKQTHAKPVSTANCSETLWTALSALGLKPDISLQREPPESMLNWGTHAWDPTKLKGQTSISSTSVRLDV